MGLLVSQGLGIRTLIWVVRYRAIYFGQTMILPKYRGRSLIQNTVNRLFLKHFLQFNRRQLIVWNDSIHYRPYLVMARGLKEFYPDPNQEDQKELELIRDKLGNRYYGKAYCAASGTVHKEQTILNDQDIQLSANDLKDPHIDFFMKRNPGFQKGDGMITLCPANFKNFRHFMIEGKLKKAVRSIWN